MKARLQLTPRSASGGARARARVRGAPSDRIKIFDCQKGVASARALATWPHRAGISPVEFEMLNSKYA